MQHGQRISLATQRTIGKGWFYGPGCSGGSFVLRLCRTTYNMLQPELAKRLLARKVENIEKLKPQIIATGNIGY